VQKHQRRSGIVVGFVVGAGRTAPLVAIGGSHREWVKD
jgi:hypothetical protein